MYGNGSDELFLGFINTMSSNDRKTLSGNLPSRSFLSARKKIRSRRTHTKKWKRHNLNCSHQSISFSHMKEGNSASPFVTSVLLPNLQKLTQQRPLLFLHQQRALAEDGQLLMITFLWHPAKSHNLPPWLVEDPACLATPSVSLIECVILLLKRTDR